MRELLQKTVDVLGPDCDLEPALLRETLPTDSGDVKVLDLWRRFDESEYGVHMDTQPLRFAAHFGYDKGRMTSDLGADVNPRLHQYQTALYTSWILDSEDRAGSLLTLARDRAVVLTFAASIHDMGETTHPAIEEEVGKTVGDIPAGHKTDEDREIEAAVRGSLYRRLYSDVQPAVLQEVEAIISHKDHNLSHEIFEVAHDLQTYMTAVQAKLTLEARRAHKRPETLTVVDDNDEMARLLNLHAEVTAAIIPNLNKRATTYEFARKARLLGSQAIRSAVLQNDGIYVSRASAKAS